MDLTTIIKYKDGDILVKLCKCEFEDAVSVLSPKVDYTIFVKSEPYQTVIFTFDILEDARDLFFKMMKADIG